MDFFNDQEYVISDEFTPETKKYAYKMFRDIKRDVEDQLHESPTGVERYLEKNKPKLNVGIILWHIARQIRRIGFTDKGAFTGLFQEGGLIYDKIRDAYYYLQGDYDIEHCHPIKVVSLRLLWGYLAGWWDCDESGKPTKGVTFLQETVFKGIATIRVLKDSHLYLTESMNNYLKDKGLDAENLLVTMRDKPNTMKEVWEWFDEGRHYEEVGIKFYPSSQMTILPFQKKVVPQHDKPHPGLVNNYIRFVSKKVRKVKPKPYVKKKDRVEVIVHDFFGDD
tara:strand:- start:35 stop:871 length:837 start_codon:yes stop_codon:yes gene_type:complete